ncbi:MAG TPA: ABC transporter substrate-binding protein [Chloroflexota bacterium]|jgi:putative ABC transport system substrate-binding protein
MNRERSATSRLSRRAFVQGAGVAGLGLLAGCGHLPGQGQMQAPVTVRRIGWLWPTPRGTTSAESIFLDRLRDHGWVEGDNVTIERRYAEDGVEQFPELAAQLVDLRPDIIVAAGAPAIRAAKGATSTVPIVMATSGADPVATGLVDSLARPGRNVTGVTLISTQLAQKRLELLRDAVPGIARVAVLWNAANPAVPSMLQETQAAARGLSVELISLPVRGPSDFEAAFAAASAEATDALLPLLDPLMRSQQASIIAFAAHSRLPALYGARHFVDAGGLMAYGPREADLFRRAADYVDRILKGAQPEDLPVEQPMTFDFVINLKTAQALGLTIPQHVLLQATEVIQ